MISTCCWPAQMTNQIILILCFWHCIKHANLLAKKHCNQIKLKKPTKFILAFHDSPKRWPIISLLRWQINTFRSFRTVLYPAYSMKFVLTQTPFDKFWFECIVQKSILNVWKGQMRKFVFKLSYVCIYICGGVGDRRSKIEYLSVRVRVYVCMCVQPEADNFEIFGRYFDFVNFLLKDQSTRWSFDWNIFLFPLTFQLFTYYNTVCLIFFYLNSLKINQMTNMSTGYLSPF